MANQPRPLRGGIIKLEPLKVTRNTKLADAWTIAEKPVLQYFNKLVSGLGPGKRWEDPDFGPSSKDETGAFSFYGSGKPAKGYPDPAKCEWRRPNYKGEEEAQTDEYSDASRERPYCDDGELFKGGASANDVIQGSLGDCWFIGALAVMGTRDDLLKKVFWGCKSEALEKKARKYGIRVCRFQKDCCWHYVFIDDQLPVKGSGKPVFAHSRDKDELWVPLVEKAYAKLHGAYDALIGGYIDGGLRDLTGLVSEELVLREGHIGFHQSNADDLNSGELWKKFDRYLNHWGAMMGCSIQPDPKSKKGGVEHKVKNEHGEDTGLMMRHAYSLVDVGEVTYDHGRKKVKLLRVRNPWGFGEWTGPWSDKSKEFKKYEADIKACPQFSKPYKPRTGKGPNVAGDDEDEDEDVEAIEANEKDGTFFMPWEEWIKYFTVVFAVVDFPDAWSGQRVSNSWTASRNCGGNNALKTWQLNPKIRFEVQKDSTHCFFSLMQDDPRLKYGRAQAKQMDPIGFQILKDDGSGSALKPPKGKDAIIEGSIKKERQMSYKLHLNNEVDVEMEAGSYVFVPTTYQKDKPGEYFVSIYSNKPVAVEHGSLIAEEEEDGLGSNVAMPRFSGKKPREPTAKEIKDAHAFEEAVADLVSDLKQSNVEMSSLANIFDGDNDGRLSWDEWRGKLTQVGIRSSLISKNHFDIFAGGDGYIDGTEFKHIFEAEKEAERVYGRKTNTRAGSSRGGGDEAFHATGGDESMPGGPGDFDAAVSPVRAKMTKRGVGRDVSSDPALETAVRHLERENSELRRELEAVKEEQARMMHVLLLYGKMLKCYDGPVHPPSELKRAAEAKAATMSVRSSRAHRSTLDDAKSQYASTYASYRGQGVRDSHDSLSGAFEAAQDQGGDEFMAVKPWKGAIHPPSNAPKSFDTSPPSATLSLEWVYGYTGQQTRSNLMYNANGDVVYFAAALGVILSGGAGASKRQTYHEGHDDDVMSFAMSEDGSLVATGQMGKKPSVRVWDAVSGSLRAKLDGFHKRGVPSLAFSACGKKLITVGNDDNHSVELWSSASGSWSGDAKKLGDSKGDKNSSLFAVGTGDDALPFATGGKDHIYFWQVSGGKLKKPKKGRFGKGGKIVLPCAARVGKEAGVVATGAATGDLLLWREQKIVYTEEGAHGKAAISTITACGPGRSMLLTGGKDCAVRLWQWNGSALERIGSIVLDGLSGVPAGGPKPALSSVCLDAGRKKLLVGTRRSEIFEIDGVEAGSSFGKGTISAKTLMEGHFADELWGLATHPTDASKFATVGDDKTLRVWDAEKRVMLQNATLPDLSRAVAWSPDGEVLACGLGGDVGRRKKQPGGVVLRDASSLGTVIGEDRNTKHIKRWVSDIKFSPDGAMLAVAAHDSKVYDKDIKKRKYKGKGLNKSSSAITHVDWSADSNFLRTNDLGYELLFYKSKDGSQQTKSSTLKDTKWATATCSLGWDVQGIWPDAADGSDVNAVDCSHSRQLVATGDDFSTVKLFRYPCVEEGAHSVVGKGHASHVTSVRFSKDDRRLFSTGGNDRTIFQWCVS